MLKYSMFLSFIFFINSFSVVHAKDIQASPQDTSYHDRLTNQHNKRYSKSGSNSRTEEAYQRSMIAFYEHQIKEYEIRREVFYWQGNSSKIIFAIVSFLVVSGVYFSWLQFHISLWNKSSTSSEKTKISSGGESDEDDLESTLKVSAQGIEVSSPVLGVIILTISLAFFYLYLVYVYPIKVIPSISPDSVSRGQQTKIVPKAAPPKSP